jgi:hypothetical protein
MVAEWACCERWRSVSSPPFTTGTTPVEMTVPGLVRKTKPGGGRFYNPTLRKGAKDGAPGVFELVESGRLRCAGGVYVPLSHRRILVFAAGLWWCWRFTSHPSQKREGWGTRGFWGWLRVGGLGLSFAAAGRPLGFDFYWVGFAGGVVVEAAPAVVFGFGGQAAGDRVAVDVLKFFGELLWG